jgi:alkanesulfonate monooxygenase SsuD/methylene tetrahydromethanopterin reductase-like flavin-dependent oxidoreductase (luciferase family)
VSATLNLLTWVGARTTTLRLGTAVIVLAWHNPVLLAEQAATLDLLSGGRLDFGIGKGYRYNEFSGFCVPMAEADERFDESLAVMLKAWTSDAPWSHRGKHWQFDGVVVEPPPAQKPHPRLWMGAGSPQSIKKVAALGYNLLLDQFTLVEEIADRIALYRSELEAHGRAFDPLNVGVTRSVNVVMTAEERQRAVEARLAGRQRIDRLTVGPDGQGRARNLSAEEADAGALYGTPDEIAAKLQSLRDAGAEYILLNAQGGLPTIRRFARELMPAFEGEPAIAAHA